MLFTFSNKYVRFTILRGKLSLLHTLHNSFLSKPKKAYNFIKITRFVEELTTRLKINLQLYSDFFSP